MMHCGAACDGDCLARACHHGRPQPLRPRKDAGGRLEHHLVVAAAQLLARTRCTATAAGHPACAHATCVGWRVRR
jgi:hypothetical protein